MGLLEGKKGLILNIANDRSIASHIANNVVKQGATCGYGFLPMGDPAKSERRVRKAMEEGGFARKLEDGSQQPKSTLDLYRFVSGYFRARS